MLRARSPEGSAFGLLVVQRDDGRTDPATDPFLSTEVLLSLYRDMVRLREVDAALVDLQRKGRIAFHSSVRGQEAVVVGTAAAIEPPDWVFPASREWGIVLSRGVPLSQYLAHTFGTGGDPARGRQMPGHPTARAARVVSRSSSVGGQLPHAVGVAWAARKAAARTAVVAFVGDGGTSSADFHAAMNLAGVFRAPVVVVCQNNQVALSTPASRQTAAASFARKGVAYGTPGVRVDGADLLAVYRAITDARLRAAAGGGPTLLECVTWPGTGKSGPRGEGEAPGGAAGETGGEGEGAGESGGDGAAAASRDPVARFKKHLVYLGVLDEGHDAEILTEVREEIRAAVAAAALERPPEARTLVEDVYADVPWHLREQAMGLHGS